MEHGVRCVDGPPAGNREKSEKQTVSFLRIVCSVPLAGGISG
jgi:hypothetical protein